jgi:folate/biopterin transporter
MQKVKEPEVEIEAFNPEVLAILTVYFVQGSLGLARLATSYYMKDTLHLSPADMANIGGITTLPWVIKPLYGFLSDGFPLFGYRRRSYLVLAGLVGCLSWLTLGMDYAQGTNALIAFIALGSASVAVSDVVVDSVVVERSRDGQGEAGDLQSLCWGAASVGGILSAYFSGSLLTTMSPQQVFTITSVFPLLISASSLLIQEEKIEPMAAEAAPMLREKEVDAEEDSLSTSSSMYTIKSQLGELWGTLKQPNIFLPVLFVFGWQATPDAGAAMFYFNTNELGFTPEFLGQVRLASCVASLAGVLIYRTLLKDWSIKDVIFWTTLWSIPLGLSQVLLTTHLNRDLGIPDQAFMLSDSVVLSVLGQVAFMPTLVLAAKLCPPGSEGALFASLMSIYNLAGTAASELGSVLTGYLGVVDGNYDNLTLLVAVCSLSGALPLFFIGLLDEAGAEDIEAGSDLEQEGFGGRQ